MTLPPETNRRFAAIRGLPQPRNWDDLTGVPGDEKTYSRSVPVFWRAKGRCESEASRGWQMAIGVADQQLPALTVRLDGDGVVYITQGGGTAKHAPSFVHKAGAVNDLVILVLDGSAEVFVNNYLVRREIALPGFDKGTLTRCTVGRFSSFADVLFFAASPADGVARLGQRMIAAP